MNPLPGRFLGDCGAHDNRPWICWVGAPERSGAGLIHVPGVPELWGHCDPVDLRTAASGSKYLVRLELTRTRVMVCIHFWVESQIGLQTGSTWASTSGHAPAKGKKLVRTSAFVITMLTN